MRRMTMQRWCKTFWITRTFLFFGQKIPDGLMPLFWITYRSGNMNVSVRGRWNVFFIPLMRMVSWPWNLTVGLQGKLTPQSYNFSFNLRKIEKHWKYFESPSVHPSISFRSWTKPVFCIIYSLNGAVRNPHMLFCLSCVDSTWMALVWKESHLRKIKALPLRRM